MEKDGVRRKQKGWCEEVVGRQKVGQKGKMWWSKVKMEKGAGKENGRKLRSNIIQTDFCKHVDSRTQIYAVICI